MVMRASWLLGCAASAHGGHRGVESGPRLERERGLVHEHPEAVDGVDAVGAGGGEEGSLHRVVHGVDHQLARVEALHRDRARFALHAERGGVDDQRVDPRIDVTEA